MACLPWALVGMLTLCGAGSAATLEVTSTLNEGDGSLRWALGVSETNGEPDTIRFASALAGQTILIYTALPALTEGGTTISGDADGDGQAHVALDGSQSPEARLAGLSIRSNDNTITRLIVRGFTIGQLVFRNASRNTVTGCLLNTDATGTTATLRGDGVWIIGGRSNRIGVAGQPRNLIVGLPNCVGLVHTRANFVANNLIGTDLTGQRPLARQSVGVAVISVPLACSENVIGGPNPGQGNVISGVETGVRISGPEASRNRVQGNYLGFDVTGLQPVPNSGMAVLLSEGATGNMIGGTRDRGGNAILHGVVIRGRGTRDNVLSGNGIGINAAGFGGFGEARGIKVTESAGRQTIGGPYRKHGNRIAGDPFGNCLFFDGAGQDTVVRSNVFGRDVEGGKAGWSSTGIAIYWARVKVLDNLIADQSGRGIYVQGATCIISRNIFAANPAAVLVGESGDPNLGCLANISSEDDGGNVFRLNNTWFVYSYRLAGPKIWAENNGFGLSTPAEVHARIWDGRDDPLLALVDVDPLLPPRAPPARAAGLRLASLAALPTRQGAEVAFALSAGAHVTVTVRNLAGRVVRTLRPTGLRPAGQAVILWDGRSDGGTSVPLGVYLVEVTARTPRGEQVRAVARLALAEP